MGYFVGKTDSTAKSVAGKITNAVKEGLSDVASRHDSIMNGDLPEFTTTCGEDEKFSGNGVEAIINSINDAYKQYNVNYRYQYHDIYKDRKQLFQSE